MLNNKKTIQVNAERHILGEDVIRIRPRGIITIPKKILEESTIKPGDYVIVHSLLNKINIEKVEIIRAKQ